jgi:hypothetical protein
MSECEGSNKEVTKNVTKDADTNSHSGLHRVGDAAIHILHIFATPIEDTANRRRVIKGARRMEDAVQQCSVL